jgi:hypothetical protein
LIFKPRKKLADNKQTARCILECYLDLCLTLKIEATCLFETSAHIQRNTQGYNPEGPGTTRFSEKKKKKKKETVVGLERGPLSLVNTTEELLDREVAAPV